MTDWKPSWRVRWLAWRCPNIRKGEWLMDLGMPTPRAVRWKQAYEWQQQRAAHRERIGGDDE